MHVFTRQTVVEFGGDEESETGGDAVSVQKSVSQTDEEVVVEYELAVERETPVAVRVVDAIPSDERIARFRGDVHYYEFSERGLELYAEAGRDPVTRISLSFHGPVADVDRFDSTPDVDLIRTLPAALAGGIDRSTVGAGGSDGDRPAVGIVATASNGDALVRTALRALTRGFVVLIGDRGDADVEALRLCERFGATRVSLPGTDDEGDLRRALAAAAQARSLPGLVFQESPDRRIDFDRSLADFRRAGERSIEARYEGDPDARGDSASLAVALLARNEADRIGDAVATARLFADEVIVLDGESNDGTANGAAAAGATVRRDEGDRRPGAAFRSLFRTAVERDADALVVVEVDGRYDVSDLPRLLEDHRRADAEITVGRPSDGDARLGVGSLRSTRRWIATRRTLARLGAVRLHPLVGQFRSGFHVYDRRALETLAADDSVDEASDLGLGILSHAAKRGYRVRAVDGRDVSTPSERRSAPDSRSK